MTNPRFWYALEVVPSKVVAAMTFASREPGFETMAPVEPRLQLADAVIIGRPKLRWSPWIFITWPRQDSFGWLFEEEGQHAGIVRLMSDGSGHPRPVPDRVIVNLRRWRQSNPLVEQRALPSFKPGDVVRAYIVPGRAQEGVFMGFETGSDARSGAKAKVKVWFMGRDHDMTMPVTALELNVDGAHPAKHQRAEASH